MKLEFCDVAMTPRILHPCFHYLSMLLLFIHASIHQERKHEMTQCHEAGTLNWKIKINDHALIFKLNYPRDLRLANITVLWYRGV